jgi:hypothetical protein
MPVFQYFGLVGSFLLATLLAANCASLHRLIHSLTFRSIRRSTFGSIRSINSPNPWCWTPLVRRWRTIRKPTARPTLEARLPF